MQGRDYEIVQKVLAGDKYAYADLVNRHQDRGMTLACKMMGNREDAEEALQDAFVRAFRALSKFEWKSSFPTWFYRIVYNVCVTALEKRDEAFLDSLDDEQFQDGDLRSDNQQPDADFESAEFKQIVFEEIDKLPSVYGSIFTLFTVQEMSYSEIVEVTGLPLGTVKARLFRARAVLQSAVGARWGMKKALQEEIKKEDVV